MGWQKVKARRGKGVLKRWSSDNIKTKSATDTPRARILSEKGAGASVLYRDHVKSGGYVHETRTGKVVISHPRKMPETIYRSGNSFVDERIAEIMQSQFWQTEKRQGFQQWHYFHVVKSDLLTVVCCFSGTKAVFVEHDVLRLTLRYSALYSTDRARKLSGEVNRITWIRKEELPPEPSP